MRVRSVGAVVALVALVVVAGCLGGGGPEIVEQQCGEVAGAGGCEVTVENPSDDPATVTVTVEAITASGDVAAKNTETVQVPGDDRTTVTVAASSVGTEIDHYEVSLSS
jgi:hypothetical protein